MSIPDANEDRRATIKRAINLLDTAAPAELAAWLAGSGLHDHMKRDTVLLRQWLAAGLDLDFLRPAWEASQQLLEAAGQHQS